MTSEIQKSTWDPAKSVRGRFRLSYPFLRCESFISLDGRRQREGREMRIFCLCKSKGIKNEMMSCFLNKLCSAAHIQVFQKG